MFLKNNNLGYGLKGAIYRIILFLFLFVPIYLFGQTQQDIENILNSAEGLFKSMKVKNYKEIWNHLSERSKKTIISDVYKELSKKERDKYTEERIREDFERCGTICNSYWNVFLMNFDPDLALEQSTWKIGSIKKDSAEVILKHKTSPKPAIIKMYRENERWRVGLTESFWARK
ncbi:MAG: hypothetical protein N2745_07335 [Syntrophorhabdaceae bacterium]|nr:hypothetical protein [Syntrophorhabdaceae bacterium]